MLDMNGIALYNITYNIRYHTFDAASMPLNYTLQWIKLFVPTI